MQVFGLMYLLALVVQVVLLYGHLRVKNKGKSFHSLANAAEVVKGIPSIEKVVVTSYTEEEPDLSNIPNAVHWDSFLAKEGGLEIQFEQLPFDHPVYIMFSSGTTGKPKCLVQEI